VLHVGGSNCSFGIVSIDSDNQLRVNSHAQFNVGTLDLLALFALETLKKFQRYDPNALSKKLSDNLTPQILFSYLRQNAPPQDRKEPLRIIQELVGPDEYPRFLKLCMNSLPVMFEVGTVTLSNEEFRRRGSQFRTVRITIQQNELETSAQRLLYPFLYAVHHAITDNLSSTLPNRKLIREIILCTDACARIPFIRQTIQNTVAQATGGRRGVKVLNLQDLQKGRSVGATVYGELLKKCRDRVSTWKDIS